MNCKIVNSENEIEIEEVEKKINELNNKKNDIENIIDLWDIAKKITHKHEYVYTSYNSRKNVAEKKPISRSYFKLIEILNKFFKSTKIKNALCLAEAPGGFIEALLDNNINDIYGITLLSNKKKIPHWNKKIIDNVNVKFLDGVKKNGDLYDIDNILSFVKNIGRNSINIVTGDGGIDYSDDYNSQEENSVHIIYSEILIALLMQKNNGIFVCKIFDIYDIKTIKLLYILYSNYEEVMIYKPCISRLTNSEKYIICKNCRKDRKYLNEMIVNFERKEIDIDMPVEFTNCIYDISIKYIDIQINSINYTIDIARKKKSPDYNQIEIAKKWCIENNIKIRK